MIEQTTNIGDLILYKNNQLIAMNKPAGIAVQNDKTGDKVLIDLAEIYSKAKLNVIHRLDRPATGVVVFAKSKNALVALNQQFQDRAIEKTYLAVVKNKPEADTGTLKHYLQKNQKDNKSFAYAEKKEHSKEAVLEYTVCGKSDKYHFLKINLVTGRHHQIRAQLAAIGCPIKGDVKYGFRRGNKDRSIHLHAWKIVFHHPVTNEKVTVTAPLPDDPVWNALSISNE